MALDSTSLRAADEDFAALLDESLSSQDRFEGTLVSGKVLRIADGFAVVDVGLKSEGRVALREFGAASEQPRVGDTVELFVDRYEDRDGAIILSREKARREEMWDRIMKISGTSTTVEGKIVARTKGGYSVDIAGLVAFMPGSQVDLRPLKDISHLMRTPQQFVVLKMDRARGNVVVSRRAALETSRAEQRVELMASIREGDIFDGVVKTLTEYGAFVDIGGVDGLLHVTDISWRRIAGPAEVLSIGQAVRVVVLRFDAERGRVSLGMKQLEADPWTGVSGRYALGGRVTGRVTNVTEYGAFVEIEPGIEGLVHVNEMAWTKKAVRPERIVSTTEQVEVVVLDIDEEKHRISLSLRMAQPNPWVDFTRDHPIGSVVEGTVTSTTDFGVFLTLNSELSGLVHVSDLTWDGPGDALLGNFIRGQNVLAKVLDIDEAEERISLGIKHLAEDRIGDAMRTVSRGAIVTCTIVGIEPNGLDVLVGEAIPGFIRRNELAMDRADQHPDRFRLGDRIDAKVIAKDLPGRKLNLSIRAKESDEEKRNLADYGSESSGASLGDILGAAIKRRNAD